jgi:hypothetical protein
MVRRKRFYVGDYITQKFDGDVAFVRMITEKYKDGTYAWVYPFLSDKEYYSCYSTDTKMDKWMVITEQEAGELNSLTEKFEELHPEIYTNPCHYTVRQAKWQSFIASRTLASPRPPRARCDSTGGRGTVI